MITRRTLLGAAGTALAAAGAGPSEGAGRNRIPQRWWESAATIARLHLRPVRGRRALPIRDEAELGRTLDSIKNEGVDAIEVFAPAHGGRSFNGLDTIDRFNTYPEAGTMDDFRRLVRMAHARSMPIITFDDLGYSSVEPIEFLKASDDVAAGHETREKPLFPLERSAGRARAGPRARRHLLHGAAHALEGLRFFEA